MNCCDKPTMVGINAKCSDIFAARLPAQDINFTGYVPEVLGIGAGDYVCFAYCINCGRIDGSWPRSTEAVIEGFMGGAL